MGRPFSKGGFVSEVVGEAGFVTVSIVKSLLLAISRALTVWSGIMEMEVGVVGEQVEVSDLSEHLESRVEAERGVVGEVGGVASEREPPWVSSWTEERRLMTSRAMVLRRRSMLRGCWLASLKRFGEIIVVVEAGGWGEGGREKEEEGVEGEGRRMRRGG